MKKLLTLITVIITMLLASGFTFSIYEDPEEKTFSLDDLYDYQKEYKTEELSVCSLNTAKTYMDYRMTTVVSSRQYQFIHNYCTVDRRTGFLYDEEGFIAVALGSFYGEIGDRYYFTLETGIVLPLVKAEEKADEDTNSSGCYHVEDGSVVEFVIDSDYARSYFSTYSNGLVLDGNYNNYSLFRGSIVKVEKVLDEKRDDIVSYQIDTDPPKQIDIFQYASGY
ncbi:MAG: hypothetical protein J5365_02120 [Erysipelotrichaceae bacterium]|nr:hypothetical protein [Erysipelotrichaceae bacterium]